MQEGKRVSLSFIVVYEFYNTDMNYQKGMINVLFCFAVEMY